MTKTAMVTGAGSGIGRACALALAAEGFDVVIVGRRSVALEETAEMASEGSGRLIPMPCDVSDAADVGAMFTAVESELGRLDVLFNNAGTNVPATNFGDLEVGAWDKVIGVNLNGMFYVAHAAYNLMRKQDPRGGRIINNGSISAYVPRPGAAPYTASKHAVTGLTRAISLDGRQYDIACGQIDIGNTASDMTERMSTGVPQADGSMKPEPTMNVANVARTLVLMATMPEEANVQFVTVMATKMPYIGRG